MLQEDKGAAQGLLNILGQPQPAESVTNRSSVPTQVMSTSEDWTWWRSQRWDFAPWVKELPKRTHLRLRPDQGTDMLLSKTSFGSNQGLVANGLQVFCPCCMHRDNFPALFLKLTSNNLRSVHAQEEPMSRRTNSSMLSLKVTCKSPHNTQWSFANHTTLSPPCSPPSPSLIVWECAQFISTVYGKISSETNLIYRRTRHRHKAWELVFDGVTITQHHYDSSLGPTAIIYTDTNQQYWCSKSSKSLLSYKSLFLFPSLCPAVATWSKRWRRGREKMVAILCYLLKKQEKTTFTEN